jgi:hypothetical protein
MASFIRFSESVEPATPPSGKAILYVDTADSEVAVKKDDGSVQKFLNAVTSVNGQGGVVTLDTDDIPEGALNFYYTEGRFDTSFAGKDTDDLTEGATNLYFTPARFDIEFSNKDTDYLTEGATNFYFTPARFDTNFDQRYFVNATGLAIVSAGTASFAHGFASGRVIVVNIELECLVAENGFSVGDRLTWPNTQGTNTAFGTDDRGLNVVVDATNVNVRYGNDASVFYALNDGTGAMVTLTNANWEVFITVLNLL